jgi:hypothetical protein
MDYKESDHRFITNFTNPFKRQEQRRKSLDRIKYHKDLDFQLKLFKFMVTNLGGKRVY